MSEIATEISGIGEPVSTLEFFGQTFQERREALREIDTFREQARQALEDSVASMVGKSVLMTFRPHRTKFREWQYSLPYYSMMDEQRTPVEKQVVVQSFGGGSRGNLVSLGAGEYRDGRYDQTWYVSLGNILDIVVEQPVEPESNASL